MNLFETLAKPFLGQTKKSKSLSTQTKETRANRVLGGEIDFPRPRRGGWTWKTKTHQSSEEVSDSNILAYRQYSNDSEVSSAIDEIVNEALTVGIDNTITPTATFQDKSVLPKNTKDAIIEEHDKILELIDFENQGIELFTDWYVDGKLVGEVIIEESKQKDGIQNVVTLDPVGLRSFVEDGKRYYYFANENNLYKPKVTDENVYDESQLIVVKSGKQDRLNKSDIGYLHFARKAINSKNQIEDSLVIYRYLRSVEKRIWNVNTGRLTKTKAENYINQVMNEIKLDKYYDANTGELKGKSSVEAITDDYVFGSRDGNSATTVDVLNGDTSFLNDLNDHELFLKKLYVGMKLPINRIDESSTLDFSGEDILNQELKFLKFIGQLRKKFYTFILELLKRQLILKGIIKEEDWKKVSQDLKIIWNNDNNVVHNAKVDQMVKSAEAINELENSNIIGKVMSYSTALEKIFQMTEEDMESEKKKIKEDKKKFPELKGEEE